MPLKSDHWKSLYANFDAPISRFDCGQKCAPHNGGVPVCCDTGHAIPVIFYSEWQHLKAQSDLWHLYRPARTASARSAVQVDAQARKLKDELPHHTRLAECKGHRFCERENRSLSCRAFPFYPYITKDDRFIGLTYYWTFEDRCWVISNLQIVDEEFVRQFVETYERLFDLREDEWDNYKSWSASMRRVFSRWGRAIPLIHRDGGCYKVSPRSGRMRSVKPEQFAKHGPYKVEAALPFPGE